MLKQPRCAWAVAEDLAVQRLTSPMRSETLVSKPGVVGDWIKCTHVRCHDFSRHYTHQYGPIAVLAIDTGSPLTDNRNMGAHRLRSHHAGRR